MNKFYINFDFFILFEILIIFCFITMINIIIYLLLTVTVECYFKSKYFKYDCDNSQF